MCSFLINIKKQKNKSFRLPSNTKVRQIGSFFFGEEYGQIDFVKQQLIFIWDYFNRAYTSRLCWVFIKTCHLVSSRIRQLTCQQIWEKENVVCFFNRDKLFGRRSTHHNFIYKHWWEYHMPIKYEANIIT